MPLRFINNLYKKKRGDFSPLIIPPTPPLHTTEEGLQSQRYKDVEDLDIIRDFDQDVKSRIFNGLKDFINIKQIFILIEWILVL